MPTTAAKQLRGIELHGLQCAKQEVKVKGLGELLAASLTPMTPDPHIWHPQPSNEFMTDWDALNGWWLHWTPMMFLLEFCIGESRTSELQ